jgi:peptidoglycan L-alanyl-D-glutamate endopeptidase CwlK
VAAFGTVSQARLSTCDDRLQRLFAEVVRGFDCVIMEGHRDQATQDAYFHAGKSRLPWPKGKHCASPSQAVDAAPYLGGKASYDQRQCLHFAGYVLGVAAQLGIPLRWGGDWDGDHEAVTDQDFQDLVHFELLG